MSEFLSSASGISEAAPGVVEPAYWDNHTLADGHGLVPVAPHIAPYGMRHFGRRAIIDYAARMRGDEPLSLDQFAGGQVFNPDDFNPGTVVLFDTEYLMSRRWPPSAETGTAAPVEIPPKPIDTMPFIPGSRRGYRDAERGLLYGRDVLWGVVTPVRKAGNALVSLSIRQVKKIENGDVLAGRDLLHWPAPVETDAINHCQAAIGQSLVRTNVVRVCAEPTPKREPRQWWGWPGRLAVDHG